MSKVAERALAVDYSRFTLQKMAYVFESIIILVTYYFSDITIGSNLSIAARGSKNEGTFNRNA